MRIITRRFAISSSFHRYSFNPIPPVVFFYILKKYWSEAVEIFWVLRHTAWMTAFSCNKLNFLFWPTSTCQILIKFSFLESLWHKDTDFTSFAKKMLIFCKQPVKGNLHIFSFSWLKIRLFKILHIWNVMVKGFSKMYNFSFHKSFPMMYHLSYLDIKHGI